MKPTTAQTTWTPEETTARLMLWRATAARLAATLPADGAFQAAVETEVGYTLAALQRALVAQAGPAALRHRAGKREERQGVSYGLLRETDLDADLALAA